MAIYGNIEGDIGDVRDVRGGHGVVHDDAGFKRMCRVTLRNADGCTRGCTGGVGESM